MYYGAREMDVPPHVSISSRRRTCLASQYYNPYISGQFVETCEDK